MENYSILLIATMLLKEGLQMISLVLWCLFWIMILGTLAYHKISKEISTLTLLIAFFLTALFSPITLFPALTLVVALMALTALLNFPKQRQRFLLKPIMQHLQKHLPKMSETEKTALEAGTVWWDGELFSGNPNWQRLFDTPAPTLSEEEYLFLKGPVDTLCALINDWEIRAVDKDLPPAMWQFLKEHRFFGLMIPKKYGGLGFSSMAHSEILMKIAGCSLTVGSTVAVPNSLGPAELLLHYGTQQQKDYYLPRLATGLEIPCFGLTGPEAGSDATSLPDTGIVCYGDYQGKHVLGIRLNWNKRYITLAPMATLLGLAFKLKDPEGLLVQSHAKKYKLGITCALIPTDTSGITIGRRHLPLSAPFQNGPTQGVNVFVPLDAIIGGPEMAGQGWRMLVESLSCGRAISLPSSAAGAAKFLAAATGMYARIRTQFKQPICHFEGIQEALARMAGNTYLCEAARIMTAGSIDQGEAPSILGAIIKYHLTERSRQISIDAMDIHGGKAIMMGPRNKINAHYLNAPVSITVEGANILTRNMIIFGQGVIRCHPYLMKEMALLQLPSENVEKLDAVLSEHMLYTLSNGARAFWMGIIHWFGFLSSVPIHKQITRCSSAFAFVTDISLLVFGGKLKFKERVSARLGDLLSMMYLASCALKRFEDQKRPKEDRLLLDWVIQETLSTFWNQMQNLLLNFPNKILGFLSGRIVMPLGKIITKPNDKLDHQIAEILTSINPTRDRLIEGIYLSPHPDNWICQLHTALKHILAAEDPNASIEMKQEAQKLKAAIIAVDDFQSL
jgi:acyl-CoA dehydrogenase